MTLPWIATFNISSSGPPFHRNKPSLLFPTLTLRVCGAHARVEAQLSEMWRYGKLITAHAQERARSKNIYLPLKRCRTEAIERDRIFRWCDIKEVSTLSSFLQLWTKFPLQIRWQKEEIAIEWCTYMNCYRLGVFHRAYCVNWFWIYSVNVVFVREQRRYEI